MNAQAFKLIPSRCVTCNLDDCTPVAVGEDFEYETSDIEYLAVQCRRCDTVYLNPRPDSDGIVASYPENYHAFQFKQEEYGLIYRIRQRLEAKRLLKWCIGLPDNAKILDLGCGDGFHLELLRKFGNPSWKIEGVDCDSRAALGAQLRGLSIHHGLIEELPLQGSSYHLILMIMTIEHLAEPMKTLSRVHELLRPGGKLVIVTDNTGSPDFKIFCNRHWGGYHFPRHLFLFNRNNLALLCHKVGLESISVKTAVSPVNWTYSFRNWLKDWGAPSWCYRFFSLESPIALAIFTLLDIPLSWIGKGAILHGVFIKKELES